MSIRLIAAIGLATFAVGIVAILVSWTDIVDWEHTGSLGWVLLAAGVLVVVLGALYAAARVAQDMALVRERTKAAADNSRQTAQRIQEIRDELFLGSYSHVPGQVARLSASLAADQALPTRRAGHTATTPNDAFDGVFVLNLDSDHDKMEATSSLLRSAGVAFERFAATDGSAPALDGQWEAYLARGGSLPQERHRGIRMLASRGELGYLHSMHRLLVDARRRGLGAILVLEDDILLHREFGPRFATAWSEVPPDWKVVLLGSVQAVDGTSTSFSDHLLHPGGRSHGSYAVAIAASAFDQLIDATERFDMPFDTGALREVDIAHPDMVFAVTPPLIIADVETSAIRDGRSLDDHAAKHGWDLSEYRRT